MEETKGTILIVDDTPANIDILVEALRDDYEVEVVLDGYSALDMIETNPPDLILLDVMMPGIDGFEVCRRIKADEATRDIPILFVTVLEEMKDEAIGLELGAIDYIHKPISVPLVKARVKNHMLLKQQKDRLEKSISILEHEKELLEQKAELGIMAGGLAHDISNVLLMSYLLELIPTQRPKTDEQWQDVLQSIDSVLGSIKLGSEIVLGFKSYLKDIGEEETVVPVDTLLQAIDIYKLKFGGDFAKELEKGLPPIKCKGHQIKRVFTNLFVNAMQAVDGIENPKILLKAWCKNDKVMVSIADNGHGIPETILPKIYDERFTTKKTGTGMGLFMVKQIMGAHDGNVEVFSEPGKGAKFTVSFPVA